MSRPQRLLAAALLLATLPLAAGASAPPSERERWTRVTIDGFEIVTDAGEREAISIAKSIEALSAGVGALLGEVRDPRPTIVFIFSKRATFERYRDAFMGPGSGKSGVFSPGRDAHSIVVPSGGRVTRKLVHHEVTHSLLVPHRPHLPVWINEGLAGLFETFHARGTSARIGRADPAMLRYLPVRTPRIPLPPESVLRLTRADEDYRDPRRARRFYAQAWAMAHFLVVGNPEHRDVIPRTLELMRQGEDAVTAFETAFGAPMAAFDRELRSYVRRPGFPFVDIEVAAGSSRAAARPMSRSEVAAELGALFVRAQRLDQARPLVAAALELDPANARAWSALASLQLAAGDPAAARISYRRAAELDPADPLIAAASRLALAGDPPPEAP
jgi:hypothetical protein